MRRYIALVIATVCAGAAIVFAQYGHFIIATDFFRQQVPFIMETKRMLATGTPFWSWDTFFGDNFVGGFTFYTLTSPFVWLSCLFPYRYMLEGLFLTLVLKYVCAFLASRLYFRTMGVTAQTASAGGLIYAFSSYAVTQTFYYHFFEPMIAFPLLLAAVERYLRKRRYCGPALALAVGLTVFVNFYFAIGSLIVAAIYTFFRSVWCPRAERQSPAAMARGVGFAALGLALAAVVLLPTAAHLSGSPRLGIQTGLDSTAPWLFLNRVRALLVPEVVEQPTALFRLSGFDSCSLCLPVAGMLLPLLGLWRERRTWIAPAVALLLVIYVTPLNSAMTLFTCPSYVRWGYALALLLTLPALRLLDDARFRLTRRAVALYACAAAAVLASAAALGLSSGAEPVGGESPECLLAAYAVVLAANVACLALFARRMSRRTLAAGVALCAAVQMTAFYAFRSEWYFQRQGMAYAGMPQRCLWNNPMPRHEGPMRSRTAFVSSTFVNYPMLLGRPGVQSHQSMRNGAAQRFFTVADTLGIAGSAFVPDVNVRSFHALMSVSGLVALDGEASDSLLQALAMRPSRRGAGYTEYRCADYVPMGFAYDSHVPESYVNRLMAMRPRPDAALLLLAAMAVPDTAVARFSRVLAPLDTAQALSLDSVAARRRAVCCSAFEGTTRGFTATITLPRKNYVFFSVPADPGFTARIDGHETPIEAVNLGLAAVLVDAGRHDIVFTYLPPGLRLGGAVSLAALLLLGLVSCLERRHRKGMEVRA